MQELLEESGLSSVLRGVSTLVAENSQLRAVYYLGLVLKVGAVGWGFF
jgi:hypothetical protein